MVQLDIEIFSVRIVLDLFLKHHTAQGGVNKVLWTRPVEFPRWVVTKREKGGALPSFAPVRNLEVHKGKELIPMDKEIHFS